MSLLSPDGGDTSRKESTGHLRHLPPQQAGLEDASHLLWGTSHRWARRGPWEGVSFPEMRPPHQMGFKRLPPAPIGASMPARACPGRRPAGTGTRTAGRGPESKRWREAEGRRQAP